MTELAVVDGKKELTVAKRPLGNLPAERRAEIADQVLARYMKGEQVANMAAEYETSDVTIYALILRERQDEWRDIQTARALARLERAQDKLEHAADALSLARARESVRSAQWELERLLRRLYGQDQAQTSTAVQIVINGVRAQQYDNKAPHNEAVIDAVVVDKS